MELPYENNFENNKSLSINNTGNLDKSNTVPKTTRSGRIINRPKHIEEFDCTT